MSIRRQSIPIPIGRGHGQSKDELSPQDAPQSVNNPFFSGTGSLSPHLSAPTPPSFTPLVLNGPEPIKKIGKYIVLDQIDSSTFKALDSVSERKFKVKVRFPDLFYFFV